MIQHYSFNDIKQFINFREGELKLGEVIALAHSEFKPNPHQRFAIIGIPEDVGVSANGGLTGASTAWDAFLKAFLNIQANSLTPVDVLVLWGYIDKQTATEAYDTVVFDEISKILSYGLIPIVIGGGHNNAYPLLKALSESNHTAINCINIDPHADLRKTDIRHSGNGFSFAMQEGYLNKYAILGLHESYNNQYMVQLMLTNPNILPIWWEDIFLREKYSWMLAIKDCVQFVAEHKFGVELDLDSIENTLTSAMTPVGLTTQQSCLALYKLGKESNSAYLHLPEGVANRSDGLEQKTIGKLLVYLMLSFVKGKSD